MFLIFYRWVYPPHPHLYGAGFLRCLARLSPTWASDRLPCDIQEGECDKSTALGTLDLGEIANGAGSSVDFGLNSSDSDEPDQPGAVALGALESSLNLAAAGVEPLGSQRTIDPSLLSELRGRRPDATRPIRLRPGSGISPPLPTTTTRQNQNMGRGEQRGWVPF